MHKIYRMSKLYHLIWIAVMRVSNTKNAIVEKCNDFANNLGYLQYLAMLHSGKEVINYSDLCVVLGTK